MDLFFVPLISIIIYLGIIFGIIYMVYTWVTKFISLKQEHNNLLRELIQKMDKNLERS